MHAWQMLLMRALVRRAYCKNAGPIYICSALKVYLLKYICLNNTMVLYLLYHWIRINKLCYFGSAYIV